VTRAQLEHILRAAGSIADDDDIVVIGSQAVLGQFADPPSELLVSMEADVFPKNHPERADLIEGSIGEGSYFESTFGYYAQAVGPETAVAPTGWMERLVPLKTPRTSGVTGWCLEIHDLVLSKCVAARDKDRVYIAAAIAHGLVSRATLESRLALLPVDDARRARIAADLAGYFGDQTQ